MGLEEDGTSALLLTVLLEIAVVVENREAARLLAQRLSGLASWACADWVLTCPARRLSEAAALLGDQGQARAYYEQALEVAGKMSFRPEIALTRLQLAEFLLEEVADAERRGVIDY